MFELRAMAVSAIFLLLALPWASAVSKTDGNVTVVVDREIRLLEASGDEVALPPGIYLAEPVARDRLRLAPEGLAEEALVVRARAIEHSESIEAPSGHVVEGEDGEPHLVVLLPERAYEAVGSGGIRARGDAPRRQLSAAQISRLHMRVQKGRMRVDLPRAGERWLLGSRNDIRWSRAGSVPPWVRVGLIRGSRVVHRIAARAPNSGVLGGWKVPPSLPAGRYRVVVSTLDGSLTAVSETFELASAEAPAPRPTQAEVMEAPPAMVGPDAIGSIRVLSERADSLELSVQYKLSTSCTGNRGLISADRVALEPELWSGATAVGPGEGMAKLKIAYAGLRRVRPPLDLELRCANRSAKPGGRVQAAESSAATLPSSAGRTHTVTPRGVLEPGPVLASRRVQHPKEWKAVGSLRAYPCSWGERECNRCVPDLAKQVTNLREHGDILGFRMGTYAGLPLGSAKRRGGNLFDHWQGIQRLTGDASQYLVVTKSEIGAKGGFAVVRMATRTQSGRRFRSNRFGDGFAPSTPPPRNDVVVGYQQVQTQPALEHPGGIQVVGSVLAIAIDDEDNDEAKVVFYDFGASQTNPDLLFEIRDDRTTIGGVAIGKLRDGTYLLVTQGRAGRGLHFWVSSARAAEPAAGTYVRGTSLLSKPEPKFHLTSRGFTFATPGGSKVWPLGNNSYQNVNLASDCNGRLYLIGMTNTGSVPVATGGEDWVHVWRIDAAADLDSWSGSSDVRLTKVADRHLRCDLESAARNTALTERQCNFVAAAASYVDPDGRLVLYATEHYSDGPERSVRMMEYRNQLNPTACETVDDAWVELYHDDDYQSRSLMIDFPDRNAERYYNFKHVEDFDDDTSSARWCMPDGVSYTLYEDKEFGGAQKHLYGTGILGQEDFKKTGSFHDKASSGRFACRAANGEWNLAACAHYR